MEDIRKRSNNNSSNPLINHSYQIKMDYGGAQSAKFFNIAIFLIPVQNRLYLIFELRIIKS